jgi:hypothetical protein
VKATDEELERLQRMRFADDKDTKIQQLMMEGHKFMYVDNGAFKFRKEVPQSADTRPETSRCLW